MILGNLDAKFTGKIERLAFGFGGEYGLGVDALLEHGCCGSSSCVSLVAGVGLAEF